jgi:hypothetical protein
MSHNIRTLTMAAVQDLDHHDGTLSREGFSASHTLHRKDSRSTPLEHLHVEQQDLQALHRVRERLMGVRTALVNEMRGLLAE